MKDKLLIPFSFCVVAFIPKDLRNIAKVQMEEVTKIDMAYNELKIIAGVEYADKLMVQFKNEAYAQTGVNSTYIVNKIYETIKIISKI